MWIFIFTSFMFFAALTSGFIVYSGGKGHGHNVIMPMPFMYSTIVIILSSGTLFLASKGAKKSAVCQTAGCIYGLHFALGHRLFCHPGYAWYVLVTKWACILQS
jgi:cytochrome c oxidase subunit 3